MDDIMKLTEEKMQKSIKPRKASLPEYVQAEQSRRA